MWRRRGSLCVASAVERESVLGRFPSSVSVRLYASTRNIECNRTVVTIFTAGRKDGHNWNLLPQHRKWCSQPQRKEKEEEEKKTEEPLTELPEIPEFESDEGFDENGKKLLFTAKLIGAVKKIKILSISSLMLSLGASPFFLLFQTNVAPAVARSVVTTGVVFSLLSTLVITLGTRSYITKMYLHQCRKKVTLETLNIFGRPQLHEVEIDKIAPGGHPLSNIAVLHESDPTKTQYFLLEPTAQKTIVARLLGVSPDVLNEAFHIKSPPTTSGEQEEEEEKEETQDSNKPSETPQQSPEAKQEGTKSS